MPGFWTGGPDAHEKALREEHQPKRLELIQQQRSAQTDEQRSRIAAELRGLKEELHRKLARLGESLF